MGLVSTFEGVHSSSSAATRSRHARDRFGKIKLLLVSKPPQRHRCGGFVFSNRSVAYGRVSLIAAGTTGVHGGVCGYNPNGRSCSSVGDGWFPASRFTGCCKGTASVTAVLTLSNSSPYVPVNFPSFHT